MNKNDIGIDISQHNGYIDFEKLKKDGIFVGKNHYNVKYIIIRLGWIGNRKNHTLDTYFDDYYKKAKQSGFPIGIYVYNYCRSVASIDNACQWIEYKIKNKQIELPIFLDMEDQSIVDCGKENLTNQCTYFCNYLQKRGYKAGIYANKNWFMNYLDINKLLDYKIWLAEWNSKITFKYKVDLWQFTSSGFFNTTRLDVNKLMCDCVENVDNSVDKIKEGIFVDMKAFVNNSSYNSVVYCDSNLTKSIGIINKNEKCDCIGIFENRKR